MEIFDKLTVGYLMLIIYNNSRLSIDYLKIRRFRLMIYKNVELYNIHELVDVQNEEYGKFCRVPEGVRLQLNDAAKDGTSFCGCGSEIRFNIISEDVEIVLKAVADKGSYQMNTIAQVYFGAFQEIPVVVIGYEETTIKIKRPNNMQHIEKYSRELGIEFDPNLVRIILPYECHISIIDIFGEVAPPTKAQTPKTKYLAYGSSITHGGCSAYPMGSYAMRTAQILGVDLINFGFAGSAFLDKAMADYIAQRQDFEIATLEMGINLIWDDAKKEFTSPERFKEKVDYFVSKIVESHPDKWIFCIDLFTCGMDYAGDEIVKEFRAVVKNKVEAMNMPRLKYICGRDLLNDITGLSRDLIHPTSSGMNEIAENLSQIIKVATT